MHIVNNEIFRPSTHTNEIIVQSCLTLLICQLFRFIITVTLSNNASLLITIHKVQGMRTDGLRYFFKNAPSRAAG